LHGLRDRYFTSAIGGFGAITFRLLIWGEETAFDSVSCEPTCESQRPWRDWRRKYLSESYTFTKTYWTVDVRARHPTSEQVNLKIRRPRNRTKTVD